MPLIRGQCALLRLHDGLAAYESIALYLAVRPLNVCLSVEWKSRFTRFPLLATIGVGLIGAQFRSEGGVKKGGHSTAKRMRHREGSAIIVAKVGL